MMNRSAPAALPAQSEGCGGAENKKAPINIEALKRHRGTPPQLLKLFWLPESSQIYAAEA
ncbi:hypothetical protein SAMN05216591_0386 [Pseudomonas extremaustralis]|uniref:Uncharacterized protein n=1 Tax=Pseudomonas extremaustralis TaxID=359110 RepID=A0ABY0MXW9_9PSED|nr:hypothetical protein SAMN05216591_0386 [Pseudomonas extremaustralis]